MRVNSGPQRTRFCRAKWPAATAARDTAFFERTLAKEYARFGGGKPANVAAQFAKMKAGAAQIEPLTIRDLRAYAFGNAAIVSMTAETEARYKGKPISEKWRGVDLFAKRDGRRQVFNGQMTTIKEYVAADAGTKPGSGRSAAAVGVSRTQSQNVRGWI